MSTHCRRFGCWAERDRRAPLSAATSVVPPDPLLQGQAGFFLARVVKKTPTDEKNEPSHGP